MNYNGPRPAETGRPAFGSLRCVLPARRLDHGELRTVEQVEGGVESEQLPVFVNGDGELTIIPSPTPASPGDGLHSRKSPLAAIADAIFG